MTITLASATITDSVWGNNGLVGLDPEADVGFFSMLPASAEQVTVQIRNLLDRAWEFIALAYKGLAFLALGYTSWDEYVDARFGDLRLAVPREHRTQVVATLAGARMSVRAIAKLPGVGVATVHRELVRSVGVPTGESEPSSTLGLDGKSYPRDRQGAGRTCPTCGECHPDRTMDCPWDLFAQGVGPHPDDTVRRGSELGEPKIPATAARMAAAKTRGQGQRSAAKRTIGGSASRPKKQQPAASEQIAVDDQLSQLEWILREICCFPAVVTTLETVATVEIGAADDIEAIASRVLALVSGLRGEIAAWPALLDRLQRVTDVLPSSC